jgi:hypothetical protein
MSRADTGRRFSMSNTVAVAVGGFSMSDTVAVAIVGTAGTILVALAGYIFSERRSNIERKAAHELAEEQREHEERERRKERVFATLRDTYLDVLRQFLVERQIVDRTKNPESSREPPPMPDEGDWLELRARVDAFASPHVRNAVNAFDNLVREFHDDVKTIDGDDPTMAQLAEISLPTKRERVAWSYGQVQTLISGELERM